MELYITDTKFKWLTDLDHGTFMDSCLTEGLLMSSHNICLRTEIREIQRYFIIETQHFIWNCDMVIQYWSTSLDKDKGAINKYEPYHEKKYVFLEHLNPGSDSRSLIKTLLSAYRALREFLDWKLPPLSWHVGIYITLTSLYNLYPYVPPYYIVKTWVELGLEGILLSQQVYTALIRFDGSRAFIHW